MADMVGCLADAHEMVTLILEPCIGFHCCPRWVTVQDCHVWVMRVMSVCRAPSEGVGRCSSEEPFVYVVGIGPMP